MKKKVADFYGGKCVKCGFSDYRILEVDHIDGRGCDERDRKDYPNSHVYGRSGVEANNRLVNENPELARATRQLLCPNCHKLKMLENHEHGYRKKRYDVAENRYKIKA